MTNKPTYNYKNSGVDIELADKFNQQIANIAKNTTHASVINSIGGFSALYELPTGYSKPILTASTDGVGTTLKLAIEYNQHDNIGVDLVAMCINDLITSGSKPLFFLDYIACDQLNLNSAKTIIQSITKGCLEAKCALIGGETAEMPDMYLKNHYDLAGFAVGIVEKEKILSAQNTQPTDQLIAIPSSGFHANGYSLIRKIINDQKIHLNQIFNKKQTLIECLLKPTYIYNELIQILTKESKIHAIANITGGGITNNLPRAFKKDLSAHIDLSSWNLPPLFQWLKTLGNLTTQEMLKTLNNGIGMIIITPKSHVGQTLSIAQQFFPESFIMGSLKEKKQNQTLHYFGKQT